jgi:hypothetical protein
MRALYLLVILIFIASVGCRSIEEGSGDHPYYGSPRGSVDVGPVIMTDGASVEATVLTRNEGRVRAGARLSAGQVTMTGAHKEKFGRSSERYALSGVVQVDLTRRLYLETSLIGAHYSAVETSEEVEGGIGVGFKIGAFRIFTGGRYGFGNGHQHAEPIHYRSSGEFLGELKLGFTIDF